MGTQRNVFEEQLGLLSVRRLAICLLFNGIKRFKKALKFDRRVRSVML